MKFMENRELKSIQEAAENAQPISEELALYVLRSSAADLPQIFAAASTVRHRYFGNYRSPVFDFERAKRGMF